MNSSATSRKLQFPNSSSRVDMKLFLIFVLVAVAAAAPSSTKTEEKDIKTAEVTIVSQSDVRHVNGTNQWNYALSDGTSRFQMWFPKPSSKPNRR